MIPDVNLSLVKGDGLVCLVPLDSKVFCLRIRN